MAGTEGPHREMSCDHVGG